MKKEKRKAKPNREGVAGAMDQQDEGELRGEKKGNCSL